MFSGNRHPHVKEWRIHIGAHKTATTHLQFTLNMHRAYLAEAGVDYLSREQFSRRLKMLKLTRRPGLLGWRMWMDGKPMERRIQRGLAPARSGMTTILLSQENFLGNPRQLLTDPIYPQAESFLAPMDALSRRSDLHIFLSIRPFEDIVPSAFAHMRARWPMAERFDAIRDRVLRQPPRWSELVGRIRKALPGARMHLWTFDSFLKQPHAVMSRLSGVDIPAGALAPVPKRTRSPSREAMERLEKLDQTIAPNAYHQAARQIATNDNGTGKYAPFTDSERHLLQDVYAEDLERIRKLIPDAMI